MTYVKPTDALTAEYNAWRIEKGIPEGADREYRRKRKVAGYAPDSADDLLNWMLDRLHLAKKHPYATMENCDWLYTFIQRWERAQKVEDIAKSFADLLEAWASEEEWEDMKHDHQANGWEQGHSIIFCDANEAMAEAFLHNRMPVWTGPGQDVMSDETMKLWNEAMDCALHTRLS